MTEDADQVDARCVFTGCDQPGHSRIVASIDRGETWFYISRAPTHEEVFSCPGHLPIVLNKFAAILQERYPDIPVQTAADPLDSGHDAPTADAGDLSGVQPNRRERRALDRAVRRGGPGRRTGPGR